MRSARSWLSASTRRCANTPSGRAEEIDLRGVQHASSAWTRRIGAFDGMDARWLSRRAAPEGPAVPARSRMLAPILAALAGVAIVIQQGLNAQLRGVLNSAAWAGFVSYAVGLACMGALALALRDPLPAWSAMTRVPWWAWSGGAFGAAFIGLAIVLVPVLGAGTFMALLVAGQMLASVAFDQFGWLGLAQRPIDGPRLAGVALLIGGVILIRR